MPSIQLKELKNYKDICKYPVYFVETGTYKGETIFRLEPHFNKLFTIEIQKERYEECIKINKSNKINFYLGDSSKKLIDIIPSLDDSTFFFLDAHGAHPKFDNKKEDVPLISELKLINELYSDKKPFLIVVDDVKNFGKDTPNMDKNDGWKNINQNNIINTLTNFNILFSKKIGKRFVISLVKKSD